MKGYFVTATDTEVGKTTVCTALLRAAVSRGWKAAGLKPIETGCPAGRALGEDGQALREAAGGWLEPAQITQALYRDPVAPSVAAEREQRPVNLDTIAAAYREVRAAAPDLLLVEGAGGLLVPVRERLTMADLAAALDLPLIVVARDKLGTINHTLLTLEVARARGLAPAAVVLSRAAADVDGRSQAESNQQEIERLGDVRCTRLAALDAANAAAEADRLLRWLLDD